MLTKAATKIVKPQSKVLVRKTRRQSCKKKI